MITPESFKIENGRFVLNDKISFDMTTEALRTALSYTDLSLQPEKGTKYTRVCEDVGILGGPRDINVAWVKDGTSGENKYSIRIQNKGRGREDPPTLVSFARFNIEERNLILQYI